MKNTNVIRVNGVAFIESDRAKAWELCRMLVAAGYTPTVTAC